MNVLASLSTARSLTSLAFEQLRADILAVRLRPTERLRIHALSERYGVGTTAIREALSRLVTDGLVNLQDQRGFSVAPVSVEELMDLTRTRVDVECIALRHCIERGSIDWESNLVSAFHRLSRTPAPPSPELSGPWMAAHRQFHEALIGGSQSSLTLQLCRLLYDKLERYRNLSRHRIAPDLDRIETEHRQLMEAALARDLPRVSGLLSAHFEETAKQAEQYMHAAISGGADE